MKPTLVVGGHARYKSPRGGTYIVRLTERPSRRNNHYWGGVDVVNNADYEMLGSCVIPLPDTDPEVVAAIDLGNKLDAEEPSMEEQMAGLADYCEGCDKVKLIAKLTHGLCFRCERKFQERRPARSPEQIAEDRADAFADSRIKD